MMRTPGVTAPNPSNSMRNYRVNIPDMVGAIWQPLYDYTALPAAGAALVRFFQEPIGGPSGKTNQDTNMELNGQIPKGQRFLITGIQFEIYPGVNPSADSTNIIEFANDVYAVTRAGSLKLNIGDKQFGTQAPLMKFPPVNRLNVNAATATTVAALVSSSVYASAAGREYSTVPMILESNQNFNVEVEGLAPLPSTVDARIGVTLNGYLWRNAQ